MSKNDLVFVGPAAAAVAPVESASSSLWSTTGPFACCMDHDAMHGKD